MSHSHRPQRIDPHFLKCRIWVTIMHHQRHSLCPLRHVYDLQSIERHSRTVILCHQNSNNIHQINNERKTSRASSFATFPPRLYSPLSGGKRGDYQNCSVLYCVLKLCTVINTLRRAVLTVLWIGFCLTGPISLCVDLFVFVCTGICVIMFHTA